MRGRAPRSRREPTIALINIVFLMLVFFMVAGTLAPPLDRDMTLVRTADLEGRPPSDALVIRADGTLSFRGTDQADAEIYVSGLDPEARDEVRIVPDRTLPAAQLVALGRDLRRAGAGKVIIVTERGLE
ncbi:biopolymer transporter ExbD [uncultured Tateyamaria sp.]|uniref:ExbD/TolR family protein n=1 Tax=uncultured Tateyamaria sp. TaxID=455651 RepID=UPI0026075F15|nr:biopolymer transporter ExbD [uncultured Tateyamaria sp.]